MPEPIASRRRAPRGQGAALHDQLLAAALDLLAATGSEDAVSLRAVADRVGVSVPSIYLHFADKQALLDAVCERVFGDLDVAMLTAAGDAPDPFEGLRRMGVAYVSFALAHPEQYRIAMMRQPSYPSGHAPPEYPPDVVAHDAFGHLVEGVRKAISAGILQGDPVQLGLLLWSAAHGAASLLIAKPGFPWPEPEAFVDAAISAAGLGLAVAARLPGDLPLQERVRRLDTLA